MTCFLYGFLGVLWLAGAGYGLFTVPQSHDPWRAFFAAMCLGWAVFNFIEQAKSK